MASSPSHCVIYLVVFGQSLMAAASRFQPPSAGAEARNATKPELAGDLLARAHERGIRAAFVAGDEVYGGRLRHEVARDEWAIRKEGRLMVLAAG